MNKSFFTKGAFTLLASFFVLTGCTEKDVYQGEAKNQPLDPSEVFDFSLTKEVKLNVDYGFTNDYYVLFHLYEENPMVLEGDSWIKDETLMPVYTAATDTKGQYSGTITIPSYIKEVWLYSDYLGTVSPVKLTVSDGGTISFNQKEYIASLRTTTRATASNSYVYPDDWTLLSSDVTWDLQGLPSNLEPERSLPEQNMLDRINNIYRKQSNLGVSDYVNNDATSEIEVIKPTEISLVFLNSSASFNNTVGYFTFPSNTKPALSSIKKILAFPNASPSTKKDNKGALVPGDEIKLKYWKESTNEFEDKFPAGVTVGFCLLPNAFSNETGTIKKPGYAPARYSYRPFNEDGLQRIIALRDGDANQIVAIGFEDNTDFDFCDATFYIKVAEKNAIGGGPELPPYNEDEEYDLTYSGTLTFEDQWPSEGDYDMNDVIMEYKSTVYRKVKGNKVFKTVDRFTPVHNGGTYTCGFGYQLSTSKPAKSITISQDSPQSARVETSQEKPVIILFDDVKDVLGQTFTITTELNDESERDIVPPYNPFIFVNDREEGREIHMVNYPPTGKADTSLFNTASDASNPGGGVYYVARYTDKDGLTLMPFGINLPRLTNFNIPTESVKIYDTYPNFINWVKSKGAKNPDWYKK